ncbi:hypothetical protein GTO91_02825 [Heliobacterium undosum]|uniref:Uncharacterized protein n=1 Tax=Heliomicrobium undosum TaxID=121734 RepID=A0A845KYM8_9FIRM|nr:hypothetical protein [Heliomicrobium undosum]MZP28653.1 hypothetical protein [Heliomicrobium undosum]
MDEFMRTGFGRKFFERDIPQLLGSLAAIAKQLEKMNERLDKLNADREEGSRPEQP